MGAKTCGLFGEHDPDIPTTTIEHGEYRLDDQGIVRKIKSSTSAISDYGFSELVDYPSSSTQCGHPANTGHPSGTSITGVAEADQLMRATDLYDVELLLSFGRGALRAAAAVD